jgi:hypothetical protein
MLDVAGLQPDCVLIGVEDGTEAGLVGSGNDVVVAAAVVGNGKVDIVGTTWFDDLPPHSYIWHMFSTQTYRYNENIVKLQTSSNQKRSLLRQSNPKSTVITTNYDVLCDLLHANISAVGSSFESYSRLRCFVGYTC